MAVPEGASTLASWCSSITSALSNSGAASSAKRIISTAERAKLGAMMQLLRSKSPAKLRQVLLGESGGADHGVDAIGGQAGQVLPGRGQHREVHGDLDTRLSERLQQGGDGHRSRIASVALTEQVGDGLARRRGRVHRSHELHVLRSHDSRAHRAPHAPGGTQNADPDHAVTLFRRCEDSGDALSAVVPGSRHRATPAGHAPGVVGRRVGCERTLPGSAHSRLDRVSSAGGAVGSGRRQDPDRRSPRRPSGRTPRRRRPPRRPRAARTADLLGPRPLAVPTATSTTLTASVTVTVTVTVTTARSRPPSRPRSRPPSRPPRPPSRRSDERRSEESRAAPLAVGGPAGAVAAVVVATHGNQADAVVAVTRSPPAR